MKYEALFDAIDRAWRKSKRSIIINFLIGLAEGFSLTVCLCVWAELIINAINKRRGA